jgi:hypothetical protein
MAINNLGVLKKIIGETYNPKNKTKFKGTHKLKKTYASYVVKSATVSLFPWIIIRSHASVDTHIYCMAINNLCALKKALEKPTTLKIKQSLKEHIS